MELVQHYLETYLDVGEEPFLEKYNHPFLLFPEKHGTGNFSTYHTRMADRGSGSRIAGTGKEIKQFRVIEVSGSHYDMPPTVILTTDGPLWPISLLLCSFQDSAISVEHPAFEGWTEST